MLIEKIAVETLHSLINTQIKIDIKNFDNNNST